MKDKMVLLTLPHYSQEFVTCYSDVKYPGRRNYYPVKVISEEYVDLMTQTAFDCILDAIQFYGCFFSEVEYKIDRFGVKYFVYTMNYDCFEFIGESRYCFDK